MWSKRQLSFLFRYYRNSSITTLAKVVEKHPEAVRSKARRLGLSRSPWPQRSGTTLYDGNGRKRKVN